MKMIIHFIIEKVCVLLISICLIIGCTTHINYSETDQEPLGENYMELTEIDRDFSETRKL